jgi:hypothetical protein
MRIFADTLSRRSSEPAAANTQSHKQEPMTDQTPSGGAIPAPSPLTRQQLYELVWSKPISQVARAYGMSGVGFAKLCERNDVPTPPRGYWAKKRNGKAVTRRPLPKARDGAPPAIVVARPKPVEQAPREPQPSPPLDVDVAAAVQMAERIGTIAPRSDLQQAHRLVTRLQREYVRKFKQRARDRLEPVVSRPFRPSAIEVSEGMLERALRILDAVFSAFEALKFPLKIEGDYRIVVSVAILGETFHLRIRERLTTRPFDAKRDKREDRSSWRAPRQVWDHTGRLEVELRSVDQFGGLRAWGEDVPGRIEQRLDKLVRESILQVQSERERRVRHRRMEEERRAEAEKRYRQEQARRLEGKRVDALIALASRVDQSEQIRRFVAACRADLVNRPAATVPQAIDEWLTWAEAVAARIHPLTHGVERARDVAWNVSPY